MTSVLFSSIVVYTTYVERYKQYVECITEHDCDDLIAKEQKVIAITRELKEL